MSNNRAYQNLANDLADIVNERNEAYVAPSNGGSLSGSLSLSSAGSSSVAIPPVSSRNDSSGRNAAPERNEDGGEQIQRVDGYDEVFDPPITQDYECPICMMALRDPVQTPCGHRFCVACINNHMVVNGRTCPIDVQPLNQNEIHPDNYAKREISQFRVKCRTLKNKKDCPWKGTLKEIEEHLKTCDFVEVPCPKVCGQYIERRAVDHHVKKECPKRTVVCQHCKTEVQHRNYRDHLGKCQKFVVQCPNCNKKMLREKLTAGHDKECPKAQAVCEFKQYGCNWKGLRLNVQSHMREEASVAAHLSMLCTTLSVLFPGNNGREKGKDGASRSEASGGASTSRDTGSSNTVLEDLHRQRNRNAESIAAMEAKIEQIERRFRELTIRNERQHTENEASMTSVKNTLVELEARMCNGVYLWRITGYNRHLENARENIVTALHSPPFYTSFYGYKLCLRINPNGVDTGYGSHVSLFVHMMQSEWDDTLEWPFSGRISLSILDQSEDGEYKRHISETLVTRPNLLAFKRPTTPRNHKGYGYVEFAHIETLEDRQYLKNDCLLIRVQVFQ